MEIVYNYHSTLSGKKLRRTFTIPDAEPVISAIFPDNRILIDAPFE